MHYSAQQLPCTISVPTIVSNSVDLVKIENKPNPETDFENGSGKLVRIV